MNIKSFFDNQDINKANNSIIAALNAVVGKDYTSIETEEYLSTNKIDIVNGGYETRICGIISTNKENIIFVHAKVPPVEGEGYIDVLQIYKCVEPFNQGNIPFQSLTKVIEYTKYFKPNYTTAIEGVFKYNNKQELIVVWGGDNIQPGILNIDSTLGNNTMFKGGINNTTRRCNIEDNEVVSLLFPEFTTCIYDRFDFLKGGRVETGVYQFAISYMVEDDYTIFQLPSNPITAVYVNELVEDYLPSIDDGEISSSIKIMISRLDVNYKKFKLVRILKKNGIVTCKSIGEYNITGVTKTIIYNKDNDKEDINISRVLIPTAVLDRISTLTSLNNKIQAGNVTYKDDIEYQRYALDITAKYKITYANDIQDYVGNNLTDGSAIYKEGNVQVNFKTAMPEEVLSLYIGFNLKDGTKTRGFHIPGRSKRIYVTLPGEPYDRVFYENDLFGKKELYVDSNKGNGTNKWKASSIANSELNYIGDTLSAKIYQVFDTCTAEYSGGRLVSGDMSYWENIDELYPDDSNFVSMSNIDFRNTNVRHHKLPSLHYIKKKLFDIDPKLILDYKNIMIGVTLSNVVIPEEFIGKVDSIWIAYGERSIGNITIQGMTPVTPRINYYVNNPPTVVKPVPTPLNYMQSEFVFNDFNLINNKPNIKIDYIRPQYYIVASGTNAVTAGYKPPNYSVIDERNKYAAEFNDDNQDVNWNDFDATTNHTLGEIFYIDEHKYLPDNNIVVNPYKPESLYCKLRTGTTIKIANKLNVQYNDAYNIIVNYRYYSYIPVCTAHSIKRNVYMDFRQQKLVLTGTVVAVNTYGTINNIGVTSFDTFIGKTDNTLHSDFDGTTDPARNTMELIAMPNFNQGTGSSATGGKPRYPIKHNHWYKVIILDSSTNLDNFTNLGVSAFIELSKWKISKGYPINFLEGSLIFDLSQYVLLKTTVYSIVNMEYKDYETTKQIDFLSHVKMKYNMDYSSINNIYSLLTYDNSKTFLHLHPNRIHSSITAKEDENVISWRTFLAMDYYDMPMSKGSIVSLKAGNKQLFIRQRYSMFIAQVKDVLRTLDANNNPIDAYLGTGDIFDRQPDEILATDKGTIQCTSKFVNVVTEYGYVGLDNINGILFIYDGSYKEVSPNNRQFIKYFCNFNNIQLNNPYYLDGLFIVHDSLNNRIYLSKTYVINPNYITDIYFLNHNIINIEDIYDYNVELRGQELYFVEDGFIKFRNDKGGISVKNISPIKVQMSVDMITGYISLHDRILNAYSNNANGFYCFNNYLSSNLFKASIIKPRVGKYEFDTSYIDICINNDNRNIKEIDTLKLYVGGYIKSQKIQEAVDKIIVYNDKFISEITDIYTPTEFYDNEHGFNKEGLLLFNNIVNQYDAELTALSDSTTNIRYTDYNINTPQINNATKLLPVIKSGNLTEFYVKSLFTGLYFNVRIYLKKNIDFTKKSCIFDVKLITTNKKH